MSSYALRFESRPWSLNVERQGNRWKRAALVKEWREAFCVLAWEAKIPRMQAIRVIAQPEFKNRSGMQDTAGCLPAVKAAIDGLVDARVIREDGPEIVQELTFLAPIVTGKNALVLTIEDISSD